MFAASLCVILYGLYIMTHSTYISSDTAWYMVAVERFTNGFDNAEAFFDTNLL